MEIQAIVQALTYFTRHFPREALEAAIAQQSAITPHLLEALDDAPRLLDRLTDDEEYMMPLYALYLLAQFREERAYPLIVAFFLNPGDAPLDLTGDFVTESLGQVLASVSGGDMAPLKRLVENTEVNEYVRNAAMGAMLTLVVEGVTSREEVITYFRSLFEGGLDRTYSFAWDSLVSASTHLCAEELLPEIRQAFFDGLVDDDMFIDLPWVEHVFAEGEAAILARLREDGHHRFINDVIAEMEWWACFQPLPRPPSPSTPVPVRLTEKVGRNAPCPCGSGRKYKHCCGKRRPPGLDLQP